MGAAKVCNTDSLSTGFPRIETACVVGFSIFCTYLINVNPVGGECGQRGRNLMPETILHVGLLIVQSDPGVGTFDFDRQKPGVPGINSDAVTKSVPRGFLKVTLLEKGMKFSFLPIL